MEEHILVVDDEECIRTLLSKALPRAGFRVTAVADGQEALALLTNGAAAPVPFDAVLTDFSMPGITGLDLVNTLRSKGVDLPCLLMSGGPDPDMLASEALARGCTGFMKKPFIFSALVEHIHEALSLQAS